MRIRSSYESLSLPSFILLLLVFNFFSVIAASDSLSDTFIQCLRNHTDPSEHVSSIVYTKSNSSYTKLLLSYIRNAVYNTSSTPKPLAILTPLHETHVQASVICAKNIGMQLKIRSGGHDYAGISYVSDVPFFILDMFNLRSVDVNVEEETVSVQVGATLGELYYRIWEKSKVHGFPAGVCPTVGVGGHITGGGYGNMMRKYGLSIDHMTDALILDVNGIILDRKLMGEDLFWAIRGGGAASFGVLLSYKLNLVPVPEKVTVFRIEKTLEDNATEVVYRWQSVAPVINNELFMRMSVQPTTVRGQKTIRISIMALFLGDLQSLVFVMDKEFPELGLTGEDCTELSWIESALWWASEDYKNPEELLNRDLNSAKFLRRKSDYVQTPISRDELEGIWKKMIELGKVELVFNPYGGNMNEIPTDATAFPHRAGNLYKIQYAMNWEEGGAGAEKNYTTQIRELHGYMTPFVSKNPRSAYMNYRDLDIGISHNGNNSYAEGKVYGVQYFNANFDRLVKVKTAFDPDNFFRNEQSIPPFPQ